MAYSDSKIVSAAKKAAERMGYTLRDKQREIVVCFVRGSDVFVSLPTGGGKSLCYGCLPWTFDQLRHVDQSRQSIVIVVSPLIASTKDQVTHLTEKA